MKKALITGVTGQDGSYLAEFLLNKDYEVHGLRRRTSSYNLENIAHLELDPHEKNKKFYLHYGDLTDSSNLNRIIEKVEPDEIYNLAAQSHVHVSFQVPEYTAEVDAIGTLRLLDAIRDTGINTKFYQASTSELFGKVVETPQSEQTPFNPQSPYSIAKLYAHWITKNYRDAYDLYACNGILFNHESPRRGRSFVTRKISTSVARIYYKKQNKMYLGNLNSRRDWGYAPDYVEAMWLMLQQQQPADYVIASGTNHSIRDYAEAAFKMINIEIAWSGTGIEEKGINKKTGETHVEIDPYYFRPTEVEVLLGDPSKAMRELDWKPKVNFNKLVEIMVEADLAREKA
ncbi:MAG: GDP-mannose 4,6-dehydratase [Candidatus Stygibacter australis]|nr:GDP-mannose 4,6-dehydratase [Candidatus Stygibacter australis]MDP8321129.1 GDP-mannose 4,6-dehydratase [Candidatus Stygibacter australis]